MGESAIRKPDPSQAGTWRKPGRCQNGECVEVRQHADVVLVRDSAHPDAIVRISPGAWQMFTDAIRAGEFDLSG